MKDLVGLLRSTLNADSLETRTSGTVNRNALEKYGSLSDSFSESVAPIRLQRIAMTGVAALHRVLSVVYEFQEASGSGATGARAPSYRVEHYQPQKRQCAAARAATSRF